MSKIRDPGECVFDVSGRISKRGLDEDSGSKLTEKDPGFWGLCGGESGRMSSKDGESDRAKSGCRTSE